MSAAPTDVGATHVALTVADLDASIAFYARYAGMKVVHERKETTRVAWISDLTRPFVLVLIEVPRVSFLLAGFNHIGVGCASRDEVDRLAAQARKDGCLALGPTDSGYPVGYWAFLRDPDGHQLEISFGQEVGIAVQAASSVRPRVS
ncbi:MAG: lactoylglutathione lyase-like lyase [Deltaproteobacteria bacterium]|nr:lactoylglutathione lyase-like lyase [Deltaproteobacteria bacterium]